MRDLADSHGYIYAQAQRIYDNELAVTPEMIAAGLAAYRRVDREPDCETRIVDSVYRAMQEVRWRAKERKE